MDIFRNGPRYLPGKETILELIASWLLVKGPYGASLSYVGRWVKTTNPGAHISRLRKAGIEISAGKRCMVLNIESACRLIQLINHYRAKRGAHYLSAQEVEYYLRAFKA